MRQFWSKYILYECYSEDPTCPTYSEGFFRVATNTGRCWNILEDTGEAIILENHTGEQVFSPNILEIYWNYSHLAPIVLPFIRLAAQEMLFPSICMYQNSKFSLGASPLNPLWGNYSPYGPPAVVTPFSSA